jgi:Ca2+-binding EF-hand superfamily protein
LKFVDRENDGRIEREDFNKIFAYMELTFGYYDIKDKDQNK